MVSIKLTAAIGFAFSFEYELPEIVAVPISYGLPAYLDWIAAATDALA